MLIVANEVSGTVTLFSIDFAPPTESIQVAVDAPAFGASSLPAAAPAKAGGSFLSGSRASASPAASRPLFGTRPIIDDRILDTQLDLLG
jgi:hypothetical protein